MDCVSLDLAGMRSYCFFLRISGALGRRTLSEAGRKRLRGEGGDEYVI